MTEPESVRLDVWLWRARFFRTRSLSSAHVRRSGVRLSHKGLTRRVEKPGTLVTVGDVITLGRGSDIVSIEVLAIGTRRGPAAEAAALYSRVETDI